MKLLLSDVLSHELMKDLEKYVELVVKATSTFAEAVRLLNEVRIGEARASFSHVIKLLDESGALKSAVEDGVAKTRLDPGFKEEMLVLINLVDDVGDHIKEASREFTILPFLEIPIQLRTGLIELLAAVSTMISKLADIIMCFIKGDYVKVEKINNEIIKLEEEADRFELENRSLLLSMGDRLKPQAIQLLVHDLNNLLENTADLCARVARRTRLIILAWLS
ncbi:MAG: DUF47 family protein [Desulfurococcaceae archaeon]